MKKTIITTKRRIDRSFEKLGHSVITHPWRFILFTLILTLGLGSQIPRIQIDTSNEGFLQKDLPAMKDYNAFRQQFGRDEIIMLAVETKNIFTLPFLSQLKNFHEALEQQVPYIDDITDLINARNTRGDEDTLAVEELLKNFPTTEKELDQAKKRILANPLYKNLLINDQHNITAIIIRLNNHETSQRDVTNVLNELENTASADQENSNQYLSEDHIDEAMHAINSIITDYEAEDFSIHIAGSMPIIHKLKQMMMRDLQRFVFISLSMIGLLLFFMFRNRAAVVFPLLTVILSLIATLGIMAISHISIKPPTQIIPSFVLVTGISNCIYLLTLYYLRRRHQENHQTALIYTLGHSGLSISLTSLTTAGGMLSFLTEQLVPVVELGIMSSVGIVFTWILSLTFLPATLTLWSGYNNSVTANKSHTAVLWLDRAILIIGRYSIRYAKPILGIMLFLLLLSIIPISTLKFSHYMLGWFPGKDPLRIDMQLIDQKLRGNFSLELVLDTNIENGLYNPALLEKIDQFATSITQIDNGTVYVGKVQSIADIAKETHQALHENNSAFYKIPNDRALIAQELLLFENSGSDDLEDFVDSQFSKARMIVKVPGLDAFDYEYLLDLVEKKAKAIFDGTTKITYTGIVTIVYEAMVGVIYSMTTSYITSSIVITLMMIAFIGDIRIGLLSMVPNLIPIVFCLAIMGLFNIPLDAFTILIGSISLGLAVDDTTHFMNAFQRYYEQTGDVATSILETLHTSGRAMFTTGLILSIGFFVYMFAYLTNLVNFGLLTGITILMALAIELLVTPALLVVFIPSLQRSFIKEK